MFYVDPTASELGTYKICVLGTAGGLEKEDNFILVIKPIPKLEITHPNDDIKITEGEELTFHINKDTFTHNLNAPITISDCDTNEEVKE